MRSRAHRGRLVTLFVIVTSLMLTLLGRLWHLQVSTAPHYARAAAETHVRRVSLPPVRGRILDVHGKPLVTNRIKPQVTVDYMALIHQPDRGRRVLTRLARFLGRPYREVADRVRLCGATVPRPCWPGSPYEPIVVADDVDARTALSIAERRDELPGVGTTLRPVRAYPLGTAAAHLLGYLRPASEPAGQDGLEAEYDEVLAGRAGVREVTVNSTGKVTGVLREQAAQPGNDLVTSIDARIQKITERAPAKAIGTARERGARADAGAAVVLEAGTGRVTALASFPGYDPKVWHGELSQRDFEAMPLASNAVLGQWAPGSTWKIVSTAAAVKAGYRPGASYDCPGSYRVGGRRFRNFGGADLGRMDLRRALVVSCDTIFYRLADQMWRRDGGVRPTKRPKDPMQAMAREFGFGERTGVDLPHEAAGLVPDRDWKRATWQRNKKDVCRRATTGYPEERDRRRAAYLKTLSTETCRDGGIWWAGDAANFAIGQGDVLVTPLQLARGYAALTNGGTLFSPRIGKAVVRPDGTVIRKIKPPVVGKVDVSGKTLRYIRGALAAVPREGTAAGAFQGFPFERLAVAGKTGTAEAYGRQDTSWFASVAPAENPKYVVVVVVSQGGTGAATAAPAAREIWEGIYCLKAAKDAKGDKSAKRDKSATSPSGDERC